MALLRWSKKYSVGVKAMDDQHIALVRILNEMHSEFEKGQAQSATGKLLRKLTEYAHTHFSSEEEMLASAGFPGLEQQREQHRELLRQLDEYGTRYQQGDQTVYLPLLFFVRDWLTTHMLKEDKEYGPWMNKLGIH
ncbi:MAG: bacteriohemerythrin [Terracidiphilus sp.]|nr:bacteriohemerythrin [Terracidiphilus sp.]